MPSLLDLFNSGDISGAGTEFNNVIGQNRNSLVGLGLGLASGGLPAALQGYQAGATTDAATQYRLAQMKQHQQELALRKSEAARQAEQWKQSFGLQQQQFERGAPELQPAPTRERFDPTLGRNVVDEFDRQTRSWKPATAPSVAGPTAAPADPYAAGAGRPVYGQTPESYAAPAAPSTGAAATQATPVMPPQKPLAAHEQAAIDEADKLANAHRAAIGNLQYAKKLSPQTVVGGVYALERAKLGAAIPFSTEAADKTLELNQVVTENTVSQLKAIFGGNPSEGERKIMTDVAGSVNLPDRVRQKIYDRAIEAATNKARENEQRAAGIRGGTYYRPGGGPQAPAAAPAGGAGARSDPFGIR